MTKGLIVQFAVGLAIFAALAPLADYFLEPQFQALYRFFFGT